MPRMITFTDDEQDALTEMLEANIAAVKAVIGDPQYSKVTRDKLTRDLVLQRGILRKVQ